MSVTINILGRTYQINVDEDNKEEVLLVEKKVLDLINSFKSAYEYKDERDLLSMAVIQFASRLQTKEKLLYDKEQDIKNILEKIEEVEKLFDDESL